MTLPQLYSFTNTHILSGGKSRREDIYFSPDTGLITPNFSRSRPEVAVTEIDLKDQYVVAPGYLELQINGIAGVHFTTLGRASADVEEVHLEKVARELARRGVTAWWATVPTVAVERWKEILPRLAPRSFKGGARLLGAHVEGPYLHPTKHGAHNPNFFQQPSTTPPASVYGDTNLRNIIKYITIAPELPGAIELIHQIRRDYPHVVISMGHSSATYEQGQTALRAGSKSITHLFNAMNPLHHRDPGLVGLISNNRPDPSSSSSSDDDLGSAPEDQLLSDSTSVDAWLSRQLGNMPGLLLPTNNNNNSTTTNATSKPECFYSIIPDTVHVHPSLLTTAHRTSPTHCILITDAIELAGLPDGTYPPNDQITRPQVKAGNRATIQNTTTLIGSCITLDECVRIMMQECACTLAQAVRCVTENVAGLMGPGNTGGRGKLDVGSPADFVLLDRKGRVVQTWVAGVKVWDSDGQDQVQMLKVLG